MVGPCFTTSWRLVSQSHGAVAWRFLSPILPHVPFPFAISLHRPILCVPWFPYPPGLSCGPVPSLVPCLYPTGPPATLWRGPTGSSSIRQPFRVPSTGRSLPAPFRFGGPVVSPSSWPSRPSLPVPFPHLVSRCCFFFPAPPAVSRLPVCSFPSPRRLLALCFAPSGGAVGCCFWLCFLFAPPFPPVHPALRFPRPCMHAHQHCTGNLVTAPLSALLLSHRPLGAWPLAVPGHARWAPLPRVSLLSPLSLLPSLLSPVRPVTVVLLLRVLSAGRPRTMAVSRALSHASGPPPRLLTCRPTWAAAQDSPSGGLPRRPPPPASPPSAPQWLGKLSKLMPYCLLPRER